MTKMTYDEQVDMMVASGLPRNEAESLLAAEAEGADQVSDDELPERRSAPLQS